MGKKRDKQEGRGGRGGWWLLADATGSLDKTERTGCEVRRGNNVYAHILQACEDQGGKGGKWYEEQGGAISTPI